jgi:phage-related protein
MDTLWIVIVGLVGLLVRAVPLFVDAGMKIIIGILEGVGNNMGKLVDAAVKVVTEFIDGISRNLPKIIDSGVNLIISFIEGLAKSVRENSDRMSTAGLDLAQAIIDGIVNGIGKGVGRVVKAAQDMVGNLWESAMKGLEAHSPSRKFIRLGMWSDQGLAIGLNKHAGIVSKAAEGVGNTALNALKKTMTNVGTVVEGTMDMQPTIRPVLDLSAIKKDSGLVAGMLKAPSLAVDAMYNKAATLSVQARANQEPPVMASEITAPVEGAKIEYVQNNYSPKALTSIDIYRQTKNQISTLKGVVS